MIRWILPVALLAALLPLNGCGRKNASPDDPGKATSVVPVSAEDLIREFKADEEGTMKKYKGTRIEVTGYVDIAEPDNHEDGPWVYLLGTQPPLRPDIRTLLKEGPGLHPDVTGTLSVQDVER